MVDGPVRVLLIEDDDEDYLLTKDFFDELPRGAYHLDRVADYQSALKELETGGYDVYLVDFRLGQRTGLELIAEAIRRGCRAPLIMLTGQREREFDLQAMQAGAFDYLVKDQLSATALERSMRYAIQQRRHQDVMRTINQELEERVTARTGELMQLNETLQAEIAVRKRIEERLRETDRKKDAFLATLAHELRNPLAALSSATQLLVLDPEPGPEQLSELSAVMSRQIGQLVRLIDDLLDVSRISGGKLKLRKAIVPLKDPVVAALDVSRPLMEAARHQLNVAEIPANVVLEGDSVRLTQIISNLLVNAAKYTPASGCIDLVTLVEVSHVSIIVRDSGVGIPAEMQRDIFEMFAQVDSSRTRSSGGLGIGLSLAKTLTEMHGGSIHVFSEGSGKGSEFKVVLPLARATTPAPVQPQPEAMSRKLPSYRILVVDDNESAAYLISRLLEKLGQEIRIAHSAEEALAAIPAFLPQIVLSDVGMPEISGLELATRIRKMKDLKQPKLVALSGYGQAEDRQEATKAGFDQYQTKPIGIQTLEQLLLDLGD